MLEIELWIHITENNLLKKHIIRAKIIGFGIFTELGIAPLIQIPDHKFNFAGNSVGNSFGKRLIYQEIFEFWVLDVSWLKLAAIFKIYGFFNLVEIKSV